MDNNGFLIKSTNFEFIKFDKLIWNDVWEINRTSNINSKVFNQWGFNYDFRTNFCFSNAVIELPLLLCNFPVQEFITRKSSFISVLKNQMMTKSFVESVLSSI